MFNPVFSWFRLLWSHDSLAHIFLNKCFAVSLKPQSLTWQWLKPQSLTCQCKWNCRVRTHRFIETVESDLAVALKPQSLTWQWLKLQSQTPQIHWNRIVRLGSVIETAESDLAVYLKLKSQTPQCHWNRRVRLGSDGNIRVWLGSVIEIVESASTVSLNRRVWPSSVTDAGEFYFETWMLAPAMTSDCFQRGNQQKKKDTGKNCLIGKKKSFKAPWGKFFLLCVSMTRWSKKI